MRRLVSVAACLFVLTAASHAQQSGDALFTRTSASEQSLKSLRGQITITRQAGGGKPVTTVGTFSLMKPNLVILTLTGDDPDVPKMVRSDGRNIYAFTDSTHYTATSIDQMGAGINAPWWMLPVRFFFNQSVNPFGITKDSTAHYSVLPSEQLGGHTVQVLGVNGSQPMEYGARFFISASGVMERSVVNFGNPAAGGAVFEAVLTNVKVNAPVTRAAFRFQPPAGSSLKAGSATDTMIAIGDAVPNFNLPAPDGTRLSLKTLEGGAKATLVNFWFLNCPPCRIEFPEFEKFYKQFKPQGLQVVAVDMGDEAGDVAAYTRKLGLTFPVALGGPADKKSVFADYRVTDNYPATYLLNDQGKIVYRAGGADVAGLRKALAQLGFK